MKDKYLLLFSLVIWACGGASRQPREGSDGAATKGDVEVTTHEKSKETTERAVGAGTDTLCPAEDETLSPWIADKGVSERLERLSRRRDGLAVVKYSACKVEVLEDCVGKGRYTAEPTSRTKVTDFIYKEKDLYKYVPLIAASLQGRMEEGGLWSFESVTVKNIDSKVASLGHEDLEGNCRGATHFVKNMRVGAFRLLTQKGARSDKSSSKIIEGGVFERCMLSPTDAESIACREVVKATFEPLLRSSGLPPSEPHSMLGQFPGSDRAMRIEATAQGKQLYLPAPNSVTVIVFFSPNCRSCEQECSPCTHKKKKRCKKRESSCQKCRAEEDFSPCAALLSSLERLRKNAGETEFQIIGVAYGMDSVIARAKLAGTEIGFPVVVDSKSASLARRYLVNDRSPSVFVVDKTGHVRFYSSGSPDGVARIETTVRVLSEE